jgi:tRNA pseudouridine38-40 synthase
MMNNVDIDENKVLNGNDDSESSSPWNRQRFACRIMYDGTAFRGWQQQGENVRTVQAVISRRLSKRFDTDMKITAASRTDQGVHARGQAGHFDVPHEKAKFEPSNLEYVLNRLLPNDVRLYNITRVDPKIDFHATGSAAGKLYVYRFCTNDIVDPLRRRYYAHFYMDFDMQLFENCLQEFVGTHDFRAYANRIEHTKKRHRGTGNGSGSKDKDRSIDTIRTVKSIKLIDEGFGYYRVEILLKSALYRMVRNIVGTSLDVAMGNNPKTRLLQLLNDAPSRYDNKAKSASPEGLSLEQVYYDVLTGF